MPERTRRLQNGIGLEIKSKFDDDDVDALVAALGEKRAYRSKFGVISWRHSDIPCLVATLGAPATRSRANGLSLTIRPLSHGRSVTSRSGSDTAAGTDWAGAPPFRSMR